MHINFFALNINVTLFGYDFVLHSCWARALIVIVWHSNMRVDVICLPFLVCFFGSDSLVALFNSLHAHFFCQIFRFFPYERFHYHNVVNTQRAKHKYTTNGNVNKSERVSISGFKPIEHHAGITVFFSFFRWLLNWIGWFYLNCYFIWTTWSQGMSSNRWSVRNQIFDIDKWYKRKEVETVYNAVIAHKTHWIR